MLVHSGMCKVLNNLYLGGLEASTCQATLSKYNIRHIISIVDNPSVVNRVEGLEYTVVEMADDSNREFGPYFHRLCDIITRRRAENRPVLVHCHAGISRSPTVVLAYLMMALNINYDDAIAFLQTKRPMADPNVGFSFQLAEFGNKCSQTMREEFMRTIPGASSLMENDRAEYQHYLEKMDTLVFSENSTTTTTTTTTIECCTNSFRKGHNAWRSQDDRVTNTNPEKFWDFTLEPTPQINGVERRGSARTIQRSLSARLRSLKPKDLGLCRKCPLVSGVPATTSGGEIARQGDNGAAD